MPNALEKQLDVNQVIGVLAICVVMGLMVGFGTLLYVEMSDGIEDKSVNSDYKDRLYENCQRLSEEFPKVNAGECVIYGKAHPNATMEEVVNHLNLEHKLDLTQKLN